MFEIPKVLYRDDDSHYELSKQEIRELFKKNIIVAVHDKTKIMVKASSYKKYPTDLIEGFLMNYENRTMSVDIKLTDVVRALNEMHIKVTDCSSGHVFQTDGKSNKYVDDDYKNVYIVFDDKQKTTLGYIQFENATYIKPVNDAFRSFVSKNEDKHFRFAVIDFMGYSRLEWRCGIDEIDNYCKTIEKFIYTELLDKRG